MPHTLRQQAAIGKSGITGQDHHRADAFARSEPAGPVASTGETAGKRFFPHTREVLSPLVSELAGNAVPITAACGARELAQQPHYGWLTQTSTHADPTQAHRATPCSTRTPTTRKWGTATHAEKPTRRGRS